MILNGKMINPGELRTKINLHSRTVSKDPGGFPVEGTALIKAGVWCKWTNGHGSEVWAAVATRAKETATVLMRYRADLDETCLIEKGNKFFEIVAIDNIQERNEYLELKVKRSGEG